MIIPRQFSISKDFEFAASHQLRGLAAGHRCARLHGHNYVVRVSLTGDLDDNGMVLDYGHLDAFKVMIGECYDHRHLNDLMDTSPTAENLAATLCADLLRTVPAARNLECGVGVSETPHCWAWYRHA